jgi:hypothetical protein
MRIGSGYIRSLKSAAAGGDLLRLHCGGGQTVALRPRDDYKLPLTIRRGAPRSIRITSDSRTSHAKEPAGSRWRGRGYKLT